jgi:hypothetical protein
MTSSKARFLLVCALLGAPLAWAGLGEPQSSIETEGRHMYARHAMAQAPQYTLHELVMADGSRVQQYVGADGRVMAVRWNTLYKPDLSLLLGNSFPAYATAAHTAAQKGGIQRHFRHEGSDLVLQSNGHLHVFSGYAYRRSLLPRGLRAQDLGLG